jgi:dihydrofolate reductase
MKLTVTTFSTLDGVMQGAGGPDEDRSNGFAFGGWLVPFADEDFGRLITEIFRRADEFLLGRTTYDAMYGFWPQITDPDDPVANGLNTLPKHVATSRPDTLEWQNSHPIVGDVVEAVGQLKERPGRELQVHGSHGLLQTLLAAGLVDEFIVWIFPLVLGQGKRLFGEGTVPTTMQLTSTDVTPAGVIVASYQPKGAPDLTKTIDIEDGKEVIV